MHCAMKKLPIVDDYGDGFSSRMVECGWGQILQSYIIVIYHRPHIPRSRLSKPTTRHSFATHLFEDGYDIGTVQELLGCAKSGSTTMIYAHIRIMAIAA
jgi:site-specific recombinase XerD